MATDPPGNRISSPGPALTWRMGGNDQKTTRQMEDTQPTQRVGGVWTPLAPRGPGSTTRRPPEGTPPTPQPPQRHPSPYPEMHFAQPRPPYPQPPPQPLPTGTTLAYTPAASAAAPLAPPRIPTRKKKKKQRRQPPPPRGVRGACTYRDPLVTRKLHGTLTGREKRGTCMPTPVASPGGHAPHSQSS